MLRKLHTDEEIVQGCLRNDARMQKRLFERYFPELMPVCLRYCRSQDDADDVLQESFVKAYGRISTYTGEGPLAAWLKKIVVRTALDKLRRMAREQKVVIPNTAEYDAVQMPDFDDQISAQEILALVQELPPVHRAVFNLHILEGWSHREIGLDLGINEGTSKWYLSEARRILKVRILILYPQKIEVAVRYAS